jgi:hypothetical protein
VYTSFMRVAIWTLALMSCVLVNAPGASPAFSLRGNLKLVDLPPAATPVEAMLVTLRPLDGGFSAQVQPDRSGNFVLKNLRPGRYALMLPMPGCIVPFARGGQALSPDGFRLAAGGEPPLRIVVSLKSSDLFVKVLGLPSGGGSFTALLAPADPRLTLQFSCYSLTLNGAEVTFRHVPTGKYRIFIIDSKFQSKVAAYAPRYPDFLKNQATPVEVLSEGTAKATATYVDGNAIRQAIRQAGPIPEH